MTRPHLLVVSAHAPDTLDELLERHAELLERRTTSADVAGHCRAAALERDHDEYRCAVVGADGPALARALRDALADPASPARGQVLPGRAPRVVAVLSGYGAQWPGMGARLAAEQLAVLDGLEQAAAALAPHLGWDPLPALLDGAAPPEDLEATAVCQPMVFAVQVALLELARAWGLAPDAVIGHSMGEVTAAWATGALSLDAAARATARRSAFLGSLDGTGGMVVLPRPRAELDALLADLPGTRIAAHNGPRTTVVSGPSAELDALLARTGDEGARVAVRAPAHGRTAEALRERVATALGDLAPTGTLRDLLSTVTGEQVDGEALDGDHWAAGFCSPVLLDEAITTAAGDGAAVWLEVGPQPSLTAGIRDRLQAEGRDDPVVPLLRRSVPGSAGPLAAAAAAWARGVPVRLEALVAEGAPRRRIPGTPWRRRRHWPAPAPTTTQVSAGTTTRRITLADEVLASHRVRGRGVLPATRWVREMAAHAQLLAGAEPVSLRDVVLREPLFLEDGDGAPEPVELELSAARQGPGTWALEARAGDGRLHATATSFVRDAGAGAVRLAPQPHHDAVLDGVEHAAALRRVGLDHGPAFLLVEEVRRGTGFAEVVVGEGHPDAVLDGALQAVAAALPDEEDAALHLPVGVARLELPADVGAVRQAVAVLRSSPGVGDSVLADVALLDAGGAPLGTFTGLRLQRTGGAGVRVPALAHATYGLRWPEAPEASSGLVPAHWDVVGDGPARDALAAALPVPNGAGDPAVVLLVDGHDAAAAVSGVVALARRTPTPTRTVIVTRGAQAAAAGDVPDPVHAAAWGAARVLRAEHEDLGVELVDLDPGDPGWATALAEHLATAAAEPELALRGDRVLVPRLRSLPTTLGPSPADALGGAEPQPYELAIEVSGVLGGLGLRPRDRVAPGPGEVEVEVEAAGVNFSDVLKTLGLYPGADDAPPLGLEAAGVVRRVGPDVRRVRPGDHVVVLAEGAFASVVVVPEALVAPAPVGLSAEVAAAVPVAHLTAHHALHELARVRPGDRVLVHSAAGGVGLAAVHLAQAAGAEVLGTAGTEDKRAMLRELGVTVVGDSRGLDWAEEVRRQTGGRGVDVVLNALAGEALAAGLRVLAPHGRFVEIGRTEIHEGTPIGLEPFKDGLSFFAVDLTLLARDRPEELGAALRSIVARIDRGELPPPVTEVVGVERAEDALRTLAQRRNTGKVVLGFGGREVLLVPARRGAPDAVVRRGVYVVTGGLGAVGGALATWLARTRADAVVVAGRRADGPGTDAVLQRLRGHGVVAEAVVADVGDPADVDRLLAHARTLGPLRGVVHAAGVLEDGVLAGLDDDGLRRVLAPKLDGALHLDAATRDDDLDLLLLVSSAAALLGPPGQGAYSAANAGLAAVAAARRARGQTALAVDLGPIAGAGMASGTAEDLARRGLRALRVPELLETLEALVGTEHAQAAVVDASWERVAQAAGTTPPPLRDLAGEGVRRGRQASRTALRARLAAARDPQAALLEHLRELVARGLGTSPQEVPTDRGLTALGMDSLMAVELRNALQRELPVRLELRRLMEGQSLAELAAELADTALAAVGEDDPPPNPAPSPAADAGDDEEHEPFPLSPIQQAYLAGRSPDLPGGGVSCHSYTEVRCTDLDLARLQVAIDTIVVRHPMLRAVIGDDGRQRVLADPGPAPLEVVDLRGLAAGEREAGLRREREARSHAVRPAGAWPLFNFSVVLLDERETVLGISFDLLLADGASLLLLTDELVAAYEGGDLAPAPAVSFRRYHELTAGIDTATDRAWWDERLDALPPAPELPVLPADPGPPAFTRRSDRLDREDWERLRERARAHGLTASGVLLGAYAEVLRAASKAPDFTLDVTTYLREPVHADVHRVVGDFTSVLLVDARDGAGSFVERCAQVQGALLDALDHRRASGVDLLRELARRRGLAAAAMPVIFTSLLTQDTGGGDLSALERLGTVAHQITQTPQALLDHQVGERDGALTWNWDAVEARFPAGLLDELFARHGALLRELAREDAPWARRRPLAPPTIPAIEPGPEATGLLHEPVLRRAAERPDAVAVRAADRTLTYGEVAAEAAVLARRLVTAGADGSAPVVVLVGRGWEQVVAVLGVLGAGTAYVPVDPELPRARMADVVARSGARLAVVGAGGSTVARAVGLEPVAVPSAGTAGVAWPEVDRTPDDLAYVIFTSGSTGRPKGVALDHRGPRGTIDEVNRRWDVGPEDVVLGVSALSFDLSVWDVFGTLGAGGCLVVPDAGKSRDPGHWTGLVREHGVTVWNSVPALMQLAVEQEPAALRSLRLVLLSGDWVPRGLAPRVQDAAPGVQVVSLGGATEASIWSIAYPIEEEPANWPSIPYGRPLAGQDVRVVDAGLDPRLPWVPGDIVIAGPGLALGYHGDPELTAASFVHHPETGERLYRTGDLGRYRPGGLIEFLGREDQQVKVQGFRVELGDVEAALLRLGGIREAASAVQRDDRGYARLVAAVVPEPGATPDVAELRRRAATLLPGYMVPTTIAVLPALPLTANGKVDRSALAAPAAAPAVTRPASRITRPVPRVAPTPAPAAATPARPGIGDEELLATVRDILRAPGLGSEDGFLAAGASSVDLIRLANVVEEREGVRPDMDELFRHGSAAWLEELIADREPTPGAGAAPDPGVLLPAGLRVTPGRYDVGADGTLTPVADDGAPVPATAAQRRLWLLHRVDPSSCAYHELLTLRLNGPVDPAALHDALRAVVDRHDALRLHLRPGADGLPELLAGPGALPFEQADLRGRPAGTAEEHAIALARRPLDLEHGPLARAALLREDDERWVLALVLHHVLGDRWAGQVFLADLGAVLRGEPLPAAPSFLEHARREAGRRRSAAHAESTAWWAERLRGAPPLELPEATHRPAAPDARGGVVRLPVPPDTVRAVRRLAASQGATAFMAVLAAVGVVLRRHGAGDDLVVGTPHGHRDSPQAERLVGFLAETLPLRLAVDGDLAFAELVGRARESCLDAYAHAHVPFDDIVRAVAPPRAPGRPPLVQVALVVQDGPDPIIELPAVTAEALDLHPGEAKFDLAFELGAAADGGWTLRVEHAEAVLGAAQARALGEHLVAVLAAGAETPETAVTALDPVAEADLAPLDGGPAPAPVDLLARVAGHAAERPGHPAVEDDGTTLGYGELAARAAQLAAVLDAQVPDGAPVALVPASTAELAIGVLAALHAQRPFLPLDPSHPDARLADAVARAGAAAVVAGPDLAGRTAFDELVAIAPDADAAGLAAPPVPAVEDAPGAPAYLVATSGTTGRPKVVEVARRGIGWLAAAQGPVFALTPEDRVAQLASPAFDACVSEVVVTLAAGATLVGRAPSALAGQALRDLLEREQVTVATLTPSVLATLPETLPATLRLLVAAGEACPPALAARVAPQVQLVNGYGPTECAVVVTMATHPPGAAGTPVLGGPLPGCRCHVVGPDGRPRPLGVPGELLVEGDHLATGYRGDPERTQDRFGPGPTGGRAYRTGDLVRRRRDGVLEHVGRIDRQLKVRGLRVEAAELEEALGALPGVRSAHVTTDGGTLVAHLAGDAVVDEAELRRRLAELLPTGLVPGRWAWYDELPRTPTGKVDGHALATVAAQGDASAAAPPADALEEELAGLMAELLGTAVPDREADFFALGGHSLLAVQLHDRIVELLEVDLPLAELLADVRVARIAALVRDRRTPGAVQNGPVALATAGAGTPLVVVHPVGGGVGPYRPLAQAAGEHRPVLGLVAPGLVAGERPHVTVAALAAHHRDVLLAAPDTGPVVLAGWSFGAVVAHALAELLIEAGRPVAGLVLLDPPAPGAGAGHDPGLLAQLALAELGLATAGAHAQTDGAADPLGAAVDAGTLPPATAGRLRDVLHAHAQALSGYVPTAIDVPAVLVCAEDGAGGAAAWRALLPGLRSDLMLPGGHLDVVGAAAAEVIAEEVAALAGEVVRGG